MKLRRASPKQIGRPRQFDPERALQRAMEVFWRKGYESASLPDLTRAMGINRPSLYAAFGNKEQLFRRVLDRYARGEATFIAVALRKPTATQVIRHIFRGAVQFLSDRNHPRGCLLMQGVPPCGDATDPVRREIVARRLATETAIRNRLQRAQAQGDLARTVSAADLARFITALVHGLSIQAASGTTRGELQTLADMAMRHAPTGCNLSPPYQVATRHRACYHFPPTQKASASRPRITCPHSMRKQQPILFLLAPRNIIIFKPRRLAADRRWLLQGQDVVVLRGRSLFHIGSEMQMVEHPDRFNRI